MVLLESTVLPILHRNVHMTTAYIYATAVATRYRLVKKVKKLTANYLSVVVL